MGPLPRLSLAVALLLAGCAGDDAAERDVPLLLVREFDWVNTTADEPLPASFGPHCAPVTYGRDPPHAVIRFGEAPPDGLRGLVVRDWREGKPPQPVLTTSADRLDAAMLGDRTTISSPFDDTLVLAEVALDGDGFVVDGTRLGPGASHVVRHATAIEHAEARYDVASILVFEHIGAASVAWRSGGLCA